MNRLMKIVSVCLTMTLFAVNAQAVSVNDWLTNTCCYPEESTEADATYVFRYRFPVFSGDEDVVPDLNEVYAYEAEYIETFTLPVNGDMYGEGAVQYYTNLNSDVTYMSDDLVSVKLTYDELTGEEPSVRVAAHVFALKGSRAGTVISLPYLLGALDMDENDEWLLERQTNKCDACVRGLVWEMLQDAAASGEVVLYDDADEEYLAGTFYPEEDFYLDANGDFVFFLQPDTMCHADAGVLTFIFSKDDLLDEL